MTLIVDSGGKGSALTGAEYDNALDSLSGVNVPETGTSLTIAATHQNDIVEFTNAGAVAVTLDLLATIIAAIDTTDFKVTLINTGAGTVTITPNGSNSINTGAATIVLSTDGYVTLQNDSTNLIWNVINYSIGAQLGILTHPSSPFATTSGASVSVTGIPSWVKRITVTLNQVSINGVANIMLRIGDSGGIHNTGYTSKETVIGTGSTTLTADTTSYLLRTGAIASSLFSGSVTLVCVDTTNHDWVATGIIQSSSVTMNIISGTTTLDTALTQLSLVTTAAFDAGEFSVHYEG